MSFYKNILARSNTLWKSQNGQISKELIVMAYDINSELEYFQFVLRYENLLMTK